MLLSVNRPLTVHYIRNYTSISLLHPQQSRCKQSPVRDSCCDCNWQKLATENKLQHRSSNKYGENLYACFGRANIEGKDAVDSWYSEVKNYTFGAADPGSNFPNVGHFTQVVWKGSQQLGVGIAAKGTSVFVVCNYDPPGNVYGQYAQHVSSR